MSFAIGICGVGQFGSHFVPLFQAHPDVEDVYLADVFADRLAQNTVRPQEVAEYVRLLDAATDILPGED